MEKTVAKIICDKTINGVTEVRNITTPTGNQGLYVKTIVGVGNPFWWFTSIPPVPPDHKIIADFTDAPIATADTAMNNTLIGQISVQPEDVLTYVPRD